jgi:5-methylcytosine-specific restriction enzyme subunit McrC
VTRVTVLEYARLTTEPGQLSLESATITTSAFQWLSSQLQNKTKLIKRVLFGDGPKSLRLGSYVGVIETPCGTQIEILPKFSSRQDIGSIRRLLMRMIAEAITITPKTTGFAHIETFSMPLPEWLIHEFLRSASRVVKIGLRRRYVETQNSEKFLRGRILTQRQMRQRAGRGHVFEIEFDDFSFDRPENRLLRSGIERALRLTKLTENWRLARELSILLSDIPASNDIAADFKAWANDRLSTHYRDVLPWCRLILTHQTPFAVSGTTNGLSMLFPMERLFEQYVASSLRRQLPRGYTMRTQVSDFYLCSYEGTLRFPLRPDILLSDGSNQWILDTKWKLLSEDATRCFDVDQADFYQLFAYGRRYLGTSGNMCLIYPMTDSFHEVRGPFELPDDLSLYLVPFDLERRSAPLDFTKD